MILIILPHSHFTPVASPIVRQMNNNIFVIVSVQGADTDHYPDWAIFILFLQ